VWLDQVKQYKREPVVLRDAYDGWYHDRSFESDEVVSCGPLQPGRIGPNGAKQVQQRDC